MRNVAIGMIGAVLFNMTLSKLVPQIDQEAFVRTYLAWIVVMLSLISWQIAGLRRRR